MVRVAIVGLGYWGPGLLRNFDSLSDSKIAAICDLDVEKLNQFSARFTEALATQRVEDVLTQDVADAVVIATPTRTHYALSKRAIEKGLHTFVEKPLATSSQECEDLIWLADSRRVVLFVGHIFLYTGAVNKLKELIQQGELGEICYISSSRLNLGPVRQDVNALWDLAPHDISIVLHLMGSPPVSVNCQGLAYLNKQLHDFCTLTINFQNGSMATLHTSWIDPNKIRRMTVVGSRKMAVYDDIEPLEKIRIYDKGVDKPDHSDSFGEFHLSYRYGDIHIPRIVEAEPLKLECQHFISCINTGSIPKTDGRNGLEVVNILAAANRSLFNSGGRVYLHSL